MGFYLQAPTNHQKADFLIESIGAKRMAKPEAFGSLPPDEALICVVDNGAFEAAAFIPDDREFQAMSKATDDRPKSWLRAPRDVVEVLSGFRTP